MKGPDLKPWTLNPIIYWGYIGIVEKTMETTIMGYVGVHASSRPEAHMAGDGKKQFVLDPGISAFSCLWGNEQGSSTAPTTTVG